MSRPPAPPTPADAQVQFNLGNRYFDGKEVPRDYAQAAKWYRMAADQGYALAQYTYGLMYEDGIGVRKNPEEAMRWFRMAAANGCKQAKTYIAAK